MFPSVPVDFGGMRLEPGAVLFELPVLGTHFGQIRRVGGVRDLELSRWRGRVNVLVHFDHAGIIALSKQNINPALTTSAWHMYPGTNAASIWCTPMT